ncbi:MAG: hypothetical protein KGZ67_04290 [Hydrogenophaga sp.]|nr:hypothetical protein [Hydrogenophaga sp.]
MNKHHVPSLRGASSKNRSRLLPWLLCLGLPMACLADERLRAPNAGVDYPGGVPGLGGLNLLAPFQYIPPAPSAESPSVDLPALKPDEQRIADLYAAGNYQAAGTAGLALMAQGDADEGLRLMMANSLAWTGRLVDAAPVYRGLASGRYADAANLGLANVQRWRGLDHEAAPLYRSVLARDPNNADAVAGLQLTARELSPRTAVSLGGSSDSSDEQRRFATINHRWRDASGTRIFEVETSKVRDELPGIEASQQDVSLRYQDLNTAFKPRFELSVPTQNHTLFGSVGLSHEPYNTSVQLGRVNWGRAAVNPNALAAGLTAVHLGVSTWHDFAVGRLSGRLNHFRISDDNTLLTSGLNLDTAWRPLGKAFKPYLGMETRETKFYAPSYWSPEQGSGTAYAGLRGEWSDTDWTVYTSAQLSGRLFGDAGNGWSVSAGGKRWIATDVAVSLSLWAMSSQRNNSAYRARSASVNLEKLWP